MLIVRRVAELSFSKNAPISWLLFPSRPCTSVPPFATPVLPSSYTFSQMPPLSPPTHPAPKLATIKFVLGKSRVAPLKQLNVPKLELKPLYWESVYTKLFAELSSETFRLLLSGQTVVFCSTASKTGKNSKVSLLTESTNFPFLLLLLIGDVSHPI